LSERLGQDGRHMSRSLALGRQVVHENVPGLHSMSIELGYCPYTKHNVQK